MLLFLLSNGLNATYLNLSKIEISVMNTYLVNLVILYCLLEQLWITRCRIVMSGDVKVNPGPKRNSYLVTISVVLLYVIGHLVKLMTIVEIL